MGLELHQHILSSSITKWMPCSIRKQIPDEFKSLVRDVRAEWCSRVGSTKRGRRRLGRQLFSGGGPGLLMLSTQQPPVVSGWESAVSHPGTAREHRLLPDPGAAPAAPLSYTEAVLLQQTLRWPERSPQDQDAFVLARRRDGPCQPTSTAPTLRGGF